MRHLTIRTKLLQKIVANVLRRHLVVAVQEEVEKQTAASLKAVVHRQVAVSVADVSVTEAGAEEVQSVVGQDLEAIAAMNPNVLGLHHHGVAVHLQLLRNPVLVLVEILHVEVTHGIVAGAQIAREVGHILVIAVEGDKF
jgi:hypothetical protein